MTAGRRQDGSAAPVPARAGRGPSGDRLRDLALVAVMAALVAALSVVPAVPVPGWPVPLTLQTLGASLAAAVLGPWRGALAVGVYVLLGLAGAPVLAGGGSGLGVLAGPSAGYLLALPVSAVVTGALVRLLARTGRHRRPAWVLPAVLAGSILVVHPLGILGSAAALDLPLRAAAVGDLVFLPGDVLKSALAAVVAAAVHRALPAVMARPVRRGGRGGVRTPG